MGQDLLKRSVDNNEDFNVPCFCTEPEEDLNDAQKAIKELMRKMIHEIKMVRVRGYDPEVLLNDTHKLMDHMFYGKCDENWYPIE